MRSRSALLFRTLPAAMTVGTGFALGACYQYTPMETAPALGAEVRAQLTDAGAVTMAPLIGPRVEALDGHIAALGDTTVTLSVTGTTDRLGNEVTWRGEQVVLPRSALAGFQRRRLDRGRSYLFGGLAVGVVAAVGVGFGINGSGGSNSSGSGGSAK